MFIKTPLVLILVAATLFCEEKMKKGVLEIIVQPIKTNNDIIGFSHGKRAFFWDNIQELSFINDKDI